MKRAREEEADVQGHVEEADERAKAATAAAAHEDDEDDDENQPVARRRRVCAGALATPWANARGPRSLPPGLSRPPRGLPIDNFPFLQPIGPAPTSARASSARTWRRSPGSCSTLTLRSAARCRSAPSTCTRASYAANTSRCALRGEAAGHRPESELVVLSLPAGSGPQHPRVHAQPGGRASHVYEAGRWDRLVPARGLPRGGPDPGRHSRGPRPQVRPALVLFWCSRAVLVLACCFGARVLFWCSHAILVLWCDKGKPMASARR